MRNLTITRRKTIVASLIKMRIYITDPTANDLVIGGESCRKLGELKNGQTATFCVEDRAAKVYAIADTISRNYCNDYYPLPVDTQDVELTGKNAFSLGAGNAFRFDGITDEAVLANRKKGRNKGALIWIVAIIVGFLIGLLPSLLG